MKEKVEARIKELQNVLRNVLIVKQELEQQLAETNQYIALVRGAIVELQTVILPSIETPTETQS